MNYFKFLLPHEGSIYLLSAFISLCFGMVIFTLRRSVKGVHDNHWAKPFALTFFVLSGMYLLRFLGLAIPGGYGGLQAGLIDPALGVCSGVTNYLFFMSAYLLSEPALGRRRNFSRVSDLLNKRGVRAALFLLLCLAGLVHIRGGWASVPDAVFSIFVLLFVGSVFYRTIPSFSDDRLMAQVALLSSVVYAGLYLLYVPGLAAYLIEAPPPGANATSTAELVTFLIALFLKFGLFFPGLSLMLLISGPFKDIDSLLRSITKKQKEYLENDGIVKSIREELQLGTLSIYLKLPDAKENKVAVFSNSEAAGDGQRGPLEVDYDPRSDYARVMESRRPVIHNRAASPYWFLRRMTKVVVPIRYHNSVIACLEGEVGAERFTEVNLAKLQRVATMVSPTIQAYRELAALNKLNHKLADLQISVVEYDLEKHVGEIMERIHDVASPLAVGVSVEIGFLRRKSKYPADGPLAELLEAQLDAELDLEDFAEPNSNRLWLKKKLVIPVVDPEGRKFSEQVVGKFVLLAEKKKDVREPPTLGTNSAFRRALSDLLTDTLLDFIRGYLNQLTDDLGARLNGLKETSARAWLDQVQTVACAAGLPWVVSDYVDEEEETESEEGAQEVRWSGRPAAVGLVRRVESPENAGKWKRLVVGKDEDLWLYSLEEPEAGTHHVIKRVLKDSRRTLWLGVARKEFGRELTYVSPWRYFIEHFCAIADSAVLRIHSMEQEEEHLQRVLAFGSLTTGVMTAGNIRHKLASLTDPLTTPILQLEEAVRDGRLQCSDALRRLILALRPERDRIEDFFNLFFKALKRNEERPCSLDEVIAAVCKDNAASLEKLGIGLEMPPPTETKIDVPFSTAFLALDVLIVNAKEAIRDAIIDGRLEERGRITISVWCDIDSGKIVCEVNDNGPGIPPGLRKKLGKKPCPSGKNNSHGYGVYLSTYTLQGLHGNLVLMPPDHRQGATFELWFPGG